MTNATRARRNRSKTLRLATDTLRILEQSPPASGVETRPLDMNAGRCYSCGNSCQSHTG